MAVTTNPSKTGIPSIPPPVIDTPVAASTTLPYAAQFSAYQFGGL